MNLLLDTHIFLWWMANDKQLSAPTKKLISDVDNLIFVSSVTAWEIAIKKQLGKLQAPEDIAYAVSQCGFYELPIEIAHATAVGDLVAHHKDPFDRLLIAQARCERLTILTHDNLFKQYDVAVKYCR